MGHWLTLNARPPAQIQTRLPQAEKLQQLTADGTHSQASGEKVQNKYFLNSHHDVRVYMN